mmetsp:Transcript_78216/g.198792  ORF Transcript_78216/g.198792 Transcript_78216/m.198792 type:complete len:238 (+) Transcript_78216:31-744(+)
MADISIREPFGLRKRVGDACEKSGLATPAMSKTLTAGRDIFQPGAEPIPCSEWSKSHPSRHVIAPGSAAARCTPRAAARIVPENSPATRAPRSRWRFARSSLCRRPPTEGPAPRSRRWRCRVPRAASRHRWSAPSLDLLRTDQQFPRRTTWHFSCWKASAPRGLHRRRARAPGGCRAAPRGRTCRTSRGTRTREARSLGTAAKEYRALSSRSRRMQELTSAASRSADPRHKNPAAPN